MAYQVAKRNRCCSGGVKGEVDAIAITGEKLMTFNLWWIKAHVEFLGPVSVYPGEDEMLALAEGG